MKASHFHYIITIHSDETKLRVILHLSISSIHLHVFDTNSSTTNVFKKVVVLWGSLVFSRQLGLGLQQLGRE